MLVKISPCIKVLQFKHLHYGIPGIFTEVYSLVYPTLLLLSNTLDVCLQLPNQDNIGVCICSTITQVLKIGGREALFTDASHILYHHMVLHCLPDVQPLQYAPPNFLCIGDVLDALPNHHLEDDQLILISMILPNPRQLQ